MSFSHKPTGSKQQNKSFKSGKHRSKGELKRAAAGKVEKRQPLKSTAKQINESKLARKARSKQIAQNKRMEIMQRNRLGAECPRTVAVIPLSPSVDVFAVADLLAKAIEEDTTQLSPSLPLGEGTVKLQGKTFTASRFKTRLTFFPVKRELLAILDITKVADIVLYVSSAVDLVNSKAVVDDFGYQTVSIVNQQGCPDVIFALQGLEQVQAKLRQSCKKACSDFCTIQFKTSKAKVLPVDNVSDATQVLRFLCEQSLHPLKWRTKRPYMLVDAVRWSPDQLAPPGSTAKQFGTLMVSGYLRGDCLLPDNIVHITGYGDAQIEKVTGGRDPYLQKRPDAESMTDIEDSVLGVSNPSKQESLERENPPDPFASEQAWPTPEELAEADEQMRTITRRVPRGTSAYQAAWIPDFVDENEGAADNDSDDDFDIDIEVDKMEGATENKLEMDTEMEEKTEKKEKKKSVSFNEDNNEVFEIENTEEGEKKTLVEEEEEEENFPDEVETPIDVPARVRFQKYRGLKSFRTSPWDPKENLPHDYSRIFQFENFRHTYKRIYEQAANCTNRVQPGQYVTIHLKNISNTQFATFPEGYPLVLSGLHKYENKISVVNFVVHRVPSYTEPVKAKNTVLIQAGFRRYTGNPIYSDNNLQGDKFRILKFFRGTAVASFYAPIMLPPSPVLMFGADEHNFGTLIAHGQLHSVNPDRILLKKILLSGLPFRVMRNKARVKQMFYSPEDVRWFKPVELHTKYGLSGRIVEALGTHGNMKCVFDGTVGQQDSIMMSLYKRVFPKWVKLPELDHPDRENKDSEVLG